VCTKFLGSENLFKILIYCKDINFETDVCKKGGCVTLLMDILNS